MMYHLTVFIMASVGLSIMLTKGGLFKPMRDWIHKTYQDRFAKLQITSTFKRRIVLRTLWFFQELIQCNLCMGFWTGMLVYIVWYRDLSVNIAIFGLVSSIASLTYAELLEYVKRQ